MKYMHVKKMKKKALTLKYAESIQTITYPLMGLKIAAFFNLFFNFLFLKIYKQTKKNFFFCFQMFTTMNQFSLANVERSSSSFFMYSNLFEFSVKEKFSRFFL